MPATNYINIPKIWPFKMVPVSATPGLHIDSSWWWEQKKSWQPMTRYFQPWVKADKTPLQIESSVSPDPLKILNPDRTVAKSINWVAVIVATGYSIYELEFDVTDLTTNRKYFLYQKVEGGPIKWEFISECIWVNDSWPETIVFKYKHLYNAHGVAWTTGIEMKFRCHAWIWNGFDPKRVRFDYVNQKRNVETMSAMPYRVFKLFVGGTSMDLGVPPFMIDILNRILSCSSIDMGGEKYQTESGSEWEMEKSVNWQLMKGSIDIVAANESSSVQANDEETLGAAIVVVYQIRSKFFAGENLVQVIDSETQ
jgi:putative component of membrane protein insertase Oxa1/YidC/SpoIIIJ protein YidD